MLLFRQVLSNDIHQVHRMMYFRTLCAFILWASFAIFTDAACRLPDAFGSGSDQWLDSYYGQLTISATDIGLPGPIPGLLIPLSCDVNSGTKYILRSPPVYLDSEDEPGPPLNLLTCMDIRRITDNKFVYYFGTEPHPLGFNMVIVANGTEATERSVCTETEPYPVGTYQTLLRADSLESENITCGFEGLYSYTLDEDGTRMCNDSLLDGCSSPYALYYEDRGCNGDSSYIANCIYVLEDANARYLTTYTNDTAVDVQDRYQCYVFAMDNSGSTFFSSRSAGSCNASQTFDYNPTEQIIVFTRYDDCITDTTVVDTTTMKVTTASISLTTTEFVDEITEDQTTSTTVTSANTTPRAPNTEAFTELPTETTEATTESTTMMITDPGTDVLTTADTETTEATTELPTETTETTEATTEPGSMSVTYATPIVSTEDSTQKITEKVTSAIETTTQQPTTESNTEKITELVTNASKTTVAENVTTTISRVTTESWFIPDNKGTNLDAYSGTRFAWSLLVMVHFVAFLSV